MKHHEVTVLALALMTGHAFAVYQDMTWVMDMNHISYHPTYEADEYQFKYHHSYAGRDRGFYVAFNTYSTVEHMGTHIDAPSHFDENGLTMDKVPLESLIGPLVRVDIREKVKLDQDAIVTVEDLQNWEKRNGRIPDGAFIIMFSGWEKFFGDQAKYVGVNETHSPGFGEEAAEWLKNSRNIKGVGTDTLGIDAGAPISPSGKYRVPTHEILLHAQKVGLENLHNVDKVPECGARISALPIIMKNGTGTQARVFAEWYPGVGFMTDCNGKLKKGEGTFVASASNILLVPVMTILLFIASTVLIN